MLTAMGRPPLPWQRDALDLILEFDRRTGVYVHPNVLLHLPRRAGKTVAISGMMHHRAMLPMRNTAGLDVMPRVWYTSQTGALASTWFREEHLPLLRGAGMFKGRWKSRLPNGSEQVTWIHNGGAVRVFAPTPDAMHSMDSDLVILDEAWAHDRVRGAQLLQGIGPTQATRRGPQIARISASGDETSTFFVDELEEARAAAMAGDPQWALLEYGVPGDEDATDVDTVARYHPAIGRTIDAAYLHTERGRLGPAGFARAYGCHQVMPRAGSKRITVDAWNDPKVIDTDPVPDTAPAAVAFDVSDETGLGSLVASVELPDGRHKIDVLLTGATVDELVDATTRAHQAGQANIGADTYGPAGDLADLVVKAGVPLTPLTAAAYTAACARFVRRFRAGRIVHRNHPALNRAIEAASTRTMGDGGWAWSRVRSEDDISTLIAATAADWLLDHAAPGFFAF